MLTALSDCLDTVNFEQNQELILKNYVWVYRMILDQPQEQKGQPKLIPAAPLITKKLRKLSRKKPF